MTDPNRTASGPSRPDPSQNPSIRPFGMVPMFNMMTAKFKGKDSEVSLGEWKSSLKTTFALQGVPPDFRAELTLCYLEGKAKREILILPQNRRDTPEKIFTELDKLYGDKVTASVLRSQFFNAKQQPQEDISTFALRLQEDFNRLKNKDPRGINENDVLLRDHLIEGLRDPATRGEFRAKILLDDTLTFETVKDELCLREQAYGETFEQAQCFTLKGHESNPVSAKDFEQLKVQLREEMNTQMTDKFTELSKTIISEIRTELQRTPPAGPADTQSWSSQFPQSRSSGRNRPRTNSTYRYDDQGKPICNNCNQPGHIARFCNGRQRSASLN